MWTLFWDMNSGGGRKETWNHIYIEADQKEAKLIFYNRFGHNPERISCTCCGPDYSINSEKSLRKLSGYHRNALCVEKRTGKNYKYDYIDPKSEIPEGFSKSKYSSTLSRPYLTIEQYENQENVLIIRKNDIKDDERRGSVPQQGYVWMD